MKKEPEFIPAEKALVEILLRRITRLQPRYFEGFREYWHPLEKKEKEKSWPVLKPPTEFAGKPLIYEEEK